MTSWVKGPDASLSATAGDTFFNATHTTKAELRRIELDRHDDRGRSSSSVIACPIAQMSWIACPANCGRSDTSNSSTRSFKSLVHSGQQRSRTLSTWSQEDGLAGKSLRVERATVGEWLFKMRQPWSWACLSALAYGSRPGSSEVFTRLTRMMTYRWRCSWLFSFHYCARHKVDKRVPAKSLARFVLSKPHSGDSILLLHVANQLPRTTWHPQT